MPRSSVALAALLLVLGLLPQPLRPLAAAPHRGAAARPPQPAPPPAPPKLPRVAEGWKITEIAAAPDILYPTAIACAPDGTVYLGQDPMDMPGPPTEPLDSVVAVRGRGAGRKISVFADRLYAVMGLEWLDGALYVVHPPYLSRFRDTDGDGKADERVDLVTGLGPAVPAFNGINDHVASGVRLGMDGFLYVSVGDKGAPRAVGKDGRTIRLHGGGVVRVRPDGTGLEVFCTGLRNPLSTMLTAADDVFTYGNDDDSKKWPNELAHCIDGGHYGYPYQFLAAPRQCLPVVAGQVGGAGTQGTCYEEDGLPERFRGNLFVTDWGLQRLFRYEIEPSGGTFRLKRPREVVAEPGPVGDFRPFALVPTAHGDRLLLVDWAYGGWLAKGPKTGRLYELTWAGAGAPAARRPRGSDSDPPEAQVESLSHPARAERLRAQRAISRLGDKAIRPLEGLLQGGGDAVARRHAVWALDAINTEGARRVIRGALGDAVPDVRRQAARALGIRRDGASARALLPLLRDRDAAVRREAAVALGRIGDPATAAALLDALDEGDAFVAWSVRTALRRVGRWDEKALTQALTGPRPRVRDNALLAVEDVYDPAVVRVLARVARTAPEGERRREVVRVLGGLYRRYPPWDGNWFGTNPLAGRFPEKTEPWDGAAMARVVETLAAVLKEDGDARVRREAIAGLVAVGVVGLPALRGQLSRESDADNRRALAAALGRLQDPEATPLLADLLTDPRQPLAVRQAAAESLAALGTAPALAHLRALLASEAEPLRAQALLTLGRAGAIDGATLAPFLGHRSAALRVAALEAARARGHAEPEVARAVLPLLDDKDLTVRGAAVAAAGALKLRAAIPRLVALAADEPARAQALTALTQLPDPRGLDAYLAGLSDRDPDLRRACQRALLAVRDLIGVELERRVRQKQVPDAALPAVERVLTRCTPLRDWKVVGPFARTNPPLFQRDEPIDFAVAHTGPNGMTVRWRQRPGEGGTGRVLLEPFKAGAGDRGGFGYDASGSPDLNAYAYGEIDAPAARDALLLVGSSGSVAVRLNGREVHNYANFAGRAYDPGSDLVRVRLRQGRNRLVVHSRQGIGAWCFSVQVSDPTQTLFAVRRGQAALEDLRAFALKNDGSAQRGARLFLDGRGVGCVKCHAVEGQGGNVGPDLAGLAAKYDRAEIITSVLEPSKRIATGYQPVLIATTRGQVLTGLVREETADHLDLVGADGKVVRVKKADIDERRVSDVSIMPVGLVDTLRPGEFADLVSYLLSLKRPAPPAKK